LNSFTAEIAESAEVKQIPNSKHQSRETRDQKITNIQKPNVSGPKFGNWNLGNIWDLIFGI